MSKLREKLTGWINDPTLLRKFNGWMTVLWFLAAPPIVIFLAESVPFIVFISVYAVVTGHLSSWQAARVEEQEKKREDAEEQKRQEDIEEIVQKVDERTPDK
jgi:type VI protein secretion system component VasK